MTEREIAIIERLRSSDYNRMADHVQEQFDKGVTYIEVWEALREVTQLFQTVAWENRVADEPKLEIGTYVTTTAQTFELDERGYFTICGIRQGIFTGEKGFDRDEMEMFAIEGLRGVYYVPSQTGLVKVTNPPGSILVRIAEVKARNGSRSDT